MKPGGRAKAPPPMIVTEPAENDEAFSVKPANITGRPGGIEVFECELKDASAQCDWYKGNDKIDSQSFRYFIKKAFILDIFSIKKTRKARKNWILKDNWIICWRRGSPGGVASYWSTKRTF